jgi:hypothetical protein
VLPRLFDEADRESPFKEPLFDVAFKVARENEAFGTRVVGIASSESGDGASLLSLGIHRSLWEMGLRSILIELPNHHPSHGKFVPESTVISPSKFWALSTSSREVFLGDLTSRADFTPNNLVVPWNAAAPIGAVRASLESVIKQLGDERWVVLLDLSAPLDNDFSKRYLSLCDLVILTARQSKTSYESARNLFNLVYLSGVKAVTAVLNGYQNLDDQSLVYVKGLLFSAIGRFRKQVNTPEVGFLRKFINRRLRALISRLDDDN